MLKVIATVAAIISSFIAITLYTITIPDVQKQAADNSAAIETLGGSVSDNAEAIETLSNVKLYEHNITIETTNNIIFTKIISQTPTYTVDSFIEYLEINQFTNNYDVLWATGRHHSGTGGFSAVLFGVYTYNDDLYAITLSANVDSPTIYSYLIEDITITDVSISIY